MLVLLFVWTKMVMFLARFSLGCSYCFSKRRTCAGDIGSWRLADERLAEAGGRRQEERKRRDARFPETLVQSPSIPNNNKKNRFRDDQVILLFRNFNTKQKWRRALVEVSSDDHLETVGEVGGRVGGPEG